MGPPRSEISSKPERDVSAEQNDVRASQGRCARVDAFRDAAP